MRVLFVDDQERVFERLRSELRRERPGWELQFVCSGSAALEQLAHHRFEAVVSAMAVSEIDGPQLLSTVRERYPGIVRLCLPAAMDDESFLRAVPDTHQFLSRPCSAETVLEVIESACTLSAILHDETIRELIGMLKALPTTPQTFQALSAAMAQPNAHTSDITGIVSKDAALAIKTLQIVNSAFFRRTAPIVSIQTAVTYVGLEMLKSLALCACMFDALEASPMAGRLLANLQARSLRKAHFARTLLGESRHAEEAFTAALMLDIGQAVLALGSPQQFERMIAAARQQGLPYHAVEPQFFGAAHPQVGACMLGLWGLPIDLVELVAYHHTPSRIQHGHTPVVVAVHVADTVIESCTDQHAKLIERLEPALLERVDVMRCLNSWNIDTDTEAGTVAGARMH